MSMTWPQVRGLSYSTMGRSVRAETWADGTYTGKVWFQPPTSWRIENASGEVTYIENATDEYRRGDDGIMVHVVKSPHRWVMMTGHAPSLLLQAYSMWLPQEQGVPAQLDEPTSPREVDVRGRTGWEVQFTDQSINRTGRIVTYAIDAETGVALSRSTPGLALELSDPLIDEPFDPALFTWTGPTRDEEDLANAGQREYEAKMQALSQMPAAQVTWTPGKIQARPIDGDPRTGALNLQVMPNYQDFTLRQWVTELGEPAGELSTRTPLMHRATVGPWTYEIRSHTPIDTGDCERIIASIVPADLPSTPADQIREAIDLEAAEQADAKLTRMLGTGRRLADYLGGDGGVSLLIRTDFSDDAKWREAAAAAMAPGEGENSDFSADLTCIDNPENNGLSIPDLIERIGDHPPYYVFIADHTTITDPEHRSSPSTPAPRTSAAPAARPSASSPLRCGPSKTTSPSATWTSTNSSSPPARTGSTVVSDRARPRHGAITRTGARRRRRRPTNRRRVRCARWRIRRGCRPMRASGHQRFGASSGGTRASALPAALPQPARAAARRARHPRIPLRDWSDGEPSGCRKRALPAVEAGWRVHRAILSGATAPLSSVSHSYATPMPAHIPR
ncbi:hypothetical protein GS966_28345 [Rhodococcus hoagii]|nr:hypothetical protein [Prescottella equi]